MSGANGFHAGPLVMVGLPGLELGEAERRLIREHQVGGVVLFRRNVRDEEQLRRLADDIHASNPEAPPLVGIDHEGGRVSRLGDPFTRFPPAALVGNAGSPHFAYREGLAMGEELRAVGIDINFAPVLDVDSNPENPVIGDRSFGSHPKTVARMGVSLAHGLQRAGVIPCGKHFPGHGDTSLDSHLSLPHVGKTLAELERLELFPFRRAIQGGVPALMTAHVVFDRVDPKNPATLSKRIVTRILREKLHFRGVLFSDDMEMKAITGQHTLEDAAVRAVEAGVDCLLYCEDTAHGIGVIEALNRVATRRARLRDRIAQARGRLDTLRKDHARRRRRPPLPLGPRNLERHRSLVHWIEERAASRAARA